MKVYNNYQFHHQLCLILILFIENRLKGVLQELKDQIFILEDFKIHKMDYDTEMDELKMSIERGNYKSL